MKTTVRMHATFQRATLAAVGGITAAALAALAVILRLGQVLLGHSPAQ